MATLEKIRNKFGVLVTIIIGLALLAFILGDVLKSGSSLFSSSQYEIAEVAGASIPVQEYQKNLNKVMEVYKMNNKGKEIDDQTNQSLKDQTWNDLIQSYVMNNEYDELGIDVSLDELEDMVVGTNLHPIIKQVFGDPKTGVVNTEGVKNFIQNINDQYKEQKPFLQYIENEIVTKRKISKFNNLVKKAVYVTQKEADMAAAEKNKEVNFDFVAKKYNEISDSLVSFTDSDIENYYNEHKSDFEQEDSRSIAYVVFDVVASADDNFIAQKWINDIVPEFKSTDNDVQFVNFNSDVDAPYDNKNYSKGELVPRLDTIMFDKEVGYVYGPYFENRTYKLAKLSEINFVPDSVKASHILLKYENDQNQYNAAHEKLDSLKLLVENGASFAELAKKFSLDGSASVGGDLGWFKEGMMVKSFSDFSFSGKKGDLGIVDSQFGTHLILITDRSAEVKKVKVGIIEREVVAGSKTLQDFYAKASKFAGENRDLDNFTASQEKLGMQRRVATISKNDKQIGGLKRTQQLVKWAFEANKNEVSDVFDFDNRYVVAVITDVKEKGIANLDDVRSQVEQVVVKKKKAAIFTEKFNSEISAGNDLNKIAQTNSLSVEKSGPTTFFSFQLPGYGVEHEVIATAVATEKETLNVVEGTSAVYVLKVVSVNDLTSNNAEVEKSRLKTGLLQRVDYEVYNALKDLAKVSDDRIKFNY